MDWSSVHVSRDGTHHVVDGHPLYPSRFDEVLAFHAPGLAPVRQADRAWHITLDGRAAYAKRFLQTFGFYENAASVVSDSGWKHITPAGQELYDATYAWCGNFQGGRCAVRDRDGRYFHISAQGAAAYGGRWRYVGDYRDGAAVVQGDDGRSTHIDSAGLAIHGNWFLDADVYHKGYARARDADGWMHIDRTGRPGYVRRFAAVEPFYNGQARVERHDGGLEVITTSGATVVELRPALRSEFSMLSSDLVGYWRTHTLTAAVELGVLEALPAGTSEVAARCRLHGPRAGRLLRALTELHVVEFLDEAWRVTSRGELLLSEHPLTLRDATLEYGGDLGRLWLRLPQAMRLDGDWEVPDTFGTVARDPARVRTHHRMLRSYARHDYVAVPRAMRLRGTETVIDAGGGVGVLAEALLRLYTDVKVVLLDRPEVVDIVHVSPDLASRLSLRAFDLLNPWRVHGDVVVLARILHDWDDHEAQRILSHARSCVPRGGRVFLIEMLLDERSAAGGCCDLHLLAVTGGRERTLREYATMLDVAGFDFERVEQLGTVPSLVVGVAR
jgi:hypothetical protein